jgi:hypothetical protein
MPASKKPSTNTEHKSISGTFRNYIQVFQGQKVTDLGNLSGQSVIGTPMNRSLFNLSKAYGTEVGVGGEINWKTGHITTKSNSTDLRLASTVGERL